MGLSTVTYALSKKYTSDTAIALGAVKGAPCQVDSIVKANGVNTIKLKWVADDKTTVQYSTFQVEDGQGIYQWIAGNTYKYNDIVIYQNKLYRCTTGNSDTTWDASKYAPVNDSDPQFGIVNKYSELPARYTAADSILYLVNNDETVGSVKYLAGFYTWTGTAWVRTLPDVLDRFTEIEIKDATSTVIGHELYFDGKKVITEDNIPYRVVNTYADIDTTLADNTMYFVENATGVGTTAAHYSGSYYFNATAKTVEFVDERETDDIDFDDSSDYKPIVEGSVV